MLLEFIYRSTGIYLFYSRPFSAAMATLFSFICAMALFPWYIRTLRRMRFSSELVVEAKDMEPVMPAGILFLVIICATTALTVRLNSYVISALVIYTFFSIIGAIDDIAKVINKQKLARGEITREQYQYKSDGISAALRLTLYLIIAAGVAVAGYLYIPAITGEITIPFISVAKTFPHFPPWIFIPLMALSIAVMANGVNFTDGFDTLSAVPMITCLAFVGIIGYISSNAIWSAYLLIPHIAGIEELLPLVGSVIGTLLAFLWFNAPPSTIIMGDSGSVGIGGLIGILFIFTKSIFYLPLVGFIFFAEFVSVVLQIGFFKVSGGKRIFLMAPIHHHFQIQMRRKPLYNREFSIKSKISWRFHIISVILLVVSLILFLKVR